VVEKLIYHHKKSTNMHKSTLFLVVLILTVTSCSLRDDGSMNFEGKAVNMLYFSTDKDLTVIKKKVIQKFGQPKYLDATENEFLYENFAFYEFKSINIKILFNTTHDHKMNADNVEPKVIRQDIGFAFVDNQGNDLLKQGSESKPAIKKHLKDLIRELEMR
jgi:hypothetical protein